MVRNGLQQPYYNLDEVRRLANERKVRFLPRDDGKSDPANLGIDEDDAIDIIAGLSITEFDITIDGDDRHPPADVYKTRRKTAGTQYSDNNLHKAGHQGERAATIDNQLP